jgi:predicted ATPase/DNA-binding CsgD family transcriptional regulator
MDPLVEAFTQREWEILALLAGDQSNQEIADQLFLSLNTVKDYNRHIYQKLGVKNRRQAVQRARELGLLEGGAPPERGAQGISTPKHNLPAALTSFIGREKEIDQVNALLSQHRLVTLTGSGGTGKTRLALQVASQQLVNFPYGVWFVELASLSDPGLVPQATLTGIGIMVELNRSPLSLLTSYLRDQHTLLVLDNCEHVIEASARLSEALLKACPSLHILATSREALKVGGEVVFQVQPLPVPTSPFQSPEEVRQSEAGRLFIERAMTVYPEFTVNIENAPAVAQICRRLDGIPLAIELAAARINLLTVEEIGARLDDHFHTLSGGSRTAPVRHQTLHALIEWSWELLNAAEQALFRRLSVFAGGWTIDAAEGICGDGGVDVFGLLSSLVDKSLVIASRSPGETTRYRMLETIRQYAGEKLAGEKLANEFLTNEKLRASGEESTYRRRHRDWFLELARRAEPELKGPRQFSWLDRLEKDHDNLRLALGWSLEHKETLPMLQLTHFLTRFWLMSGATAEGSRWLAETLELAKAETKLERSTWEAKAQLGLGILRIDRMEDLEAVRLMLDEAQSIFRDNGDLTGIAASLFALADIDYWLGNLQSEILVEECLAIGSAAQDRWIVGKCLDRLADLRVSGDYSKAQKMREESIAVIRETGDLYELSIPIYFAAYEIWCHGDTRRARQLTEEILAEFQQSGHRRGSLFLRLRLVQLYSLLGEFDRAHSMAEDSLRIAQDSKSLLYTGMANFFTGMMHYLLGELEPARRHLELSLKILGEIQLRGGYNWTLEILGQVYTRQGDIPKNIEMLEESLSMGDFGGDSRANKLLALGDAVRAQGDIARALDCYRESLEIQKGLDGIAQIPAILEAIAKVAVIENNFARAARLLGAAQSGREQFGTPLPPVDRQDYDSSLAVARSALGKTFCDRLFEEGKNLTLQQAVNEALGLLLDNP